MISRSIPATTLLVIGAFRFGSSTFADVTAVGWQDFRIGVSASLSGLDDSLDLLVLARRA